MTSMGIGIWHHFKQRQRKRDKNLPFFLPKSRTRNSGYASGFQKLEAVENIWNLSSLFSSLYSSWRQPYLREWIHGTWTKLEESLMFYEAWDNQRLELKHSSTSICFGILLFIPSVKLQTTFLQLLNPSVIILALLLSDSSIPLLHIKGNCQF